MTGGAAGSPGDLLGQDLVLRDSPRRSCGSEDQGMLVVRRRSASRLWLRVCAERRRARGSDCPYNPPLQPIR